MLVLMVCLRQQIQRSCPKTTTVIFTGISSQFIEHSLLTFAHTTLFQKMLVVIVLFRQQIQRYCPKTTTVIFTEISSQFCTRNTLQQPARTDGLC
ncbi:hypothetical protein BaRGS_00003835 [Batillaria attramentaria]|uniref:Secreted protein n=1 Tax=Batillaria attramentaria TaxID=370345 RepID=A0ABD0M0P6_9CAEN